MAWWDNNNEISVQLNVSSWIRERDFSGKNSYTIAMVFRTKDRTEATRSKKKITFLLRFEIKSFYPSRKNVWLHEDDRY